LAELADRYHLSYTVHLPLDLRLAEDGNMQHPSMIKARQVVDCTAELHPWAYVAHLDGRAVLGETDRQTKEEWNLQEVRALQQVAAWLPPCTHLAVENLEHYPLDFWDEVLEQIPCTRCIDIGHLWLDGHDALAYLHKHITRASVLHVHGVNGHDHRSLVCVPPDELAHLLRTITQSGFAGVLTLEVFGEQDFHSSMHALQTAFESCKTEKIWEQS